MNRDTARSLAAGLAGTRIALGVVAYAVPSLPARPWVGAAADTVAVTVVGRALGARDVAIGAGALLARRHDAPVRGWVEAGALADAGDLVATLLSFRSLPRTGRWAVLAATLGGVAAGRLLAPAVD